MIDVVSRFLIKRRDSDNEENGDDDSENEDDEPEDDGHR